LWKFDVDAEIIPKHIMLYVNRTFISNINTCISELQYFAHEVYVTTFRNMLRNKIYVLHINKMERKMV